MIVPSARCAGPHCSSRAAALSHSSVLALRCRSVRGPELSQWPQENLGVCASYYFSQMKPEWKAPSPLILYDERGHQQKAERDHDRDVDRDEQHEAPVNVPQEASAITRLSRPFAGLITTHARACRAPGRSQHSNQASGTSRSTGSQFLTRHAPDDPAMRQPWYCRYGTAPHGRRAIQSHARTPSSVPSRETMASNRDSSNTI